MINLPQANSARKPLHHAANDLCGMRSGRLVVIREDGRTGDGHIAWLCRCDCGKEKRISSNSLTRIRPVASCGCRNGDTARTIHSGKTPWNDGKSYTIDGGERCYKTRSGWAKAAIRHYGNKCERCGWDKARCDVHHRHHKAKGGLHMIINAIVLCPNCHRIEHFS